MFVSGRHCDDYIDDPDTPPALASWLGWARLPAIKKGPREPHPLFATFNPRGTNERVRVVMASRFGDVGITRELDRDHGYELRVQLCELKDFSDVVTAFQPGGLENAGGD